jgi:hypothetical protein
MLHRNVTACLSASLRSRSCYLAALALGLGALCYVAGTVAAEPDAAARDADWQRIAPLFQPPEQYAKDLGAYRSPLVFDDGRPVRTADDWRLRRAELLAFWHKTLGPWPPLVEKPAVETVATTVREGIEQRKLRLQIAAAETADAYLLVPSGEGRRPAVLVVYYDPETGAGLDPKKPLRDFGWQLARRGFVTLSLGWPRPYTEREGPRVQPLSTLAYVAANCHTALAAMPEVDPQRIGVVGHSFGGKWAMFAACLYDKFAAGAWSDPGIVFDEKRPNVNYWEPWYLGWEAGRTRTRGLPTADNPRTGPYKTLVETGRDLHELHMLMAPRPFLVSGGAEDPPARWQALNHSVAVNRLLGCERRVAMSNRPTHDPTEESNELLYRFFAWFLQPR